MWSSLSHARSELITHTPTRTSTHTKNLMLWVCLHTCGIVMSHGGVTCYCVWLRSSVVLTGRGGLWDRSGDSGLSDCSRCCQPVVFPPVSPFIFLFFFPRATRFVFFPSSSVHASLAVVSSPKTCISKSHDLVNTGDGSPICRFVNNLEWLWHRAFWHFLQANFWRTKKKWSQNQASFLNMHTSKYIYKKGKV